MSSGDWQRVTRNEPCVVCGKPDWCLNKRDKSAAICARVESGHKVQRAGKDLAGWFHRLTNDSTFVPRPRTIKVEPVRVTKNWSSIAARYKNAIRPAELESHARGLGVSAESLRRLGLGIDRNACAFTYPMSDATGRVIGIRLRAVNGRKFCVTGSTTGLFLPSGLETVVSTLLIAEGPTDCAALLDLGFSAVGRPSCRGGVVLLTSLVKLVKPIEVVIVSDNDENGRGQAGARSLAEALTMLPVELRIITPADGIKDARQWKCRGATAADILSAPAVTFPHAAIRRAQRHAIEHRSRVS